MKTLIIFTFITFLSINSISQVNEDARKLGSKAINLIDEQKYDEAIDLLKKAMELEPTYFGYAYEIAYISYLKKDYDKCIEQFKKILIDYDTKDQQIYQGMGNAYDEKGEKENAIATYSEGLKYNPNSGRLYLEEGIIYFNDKNLNTAIQYFENGIEKEPEFSSNYYYAAKIYCAGKSSIWGLLYGEMFLNMERASKRSYEISKLLFDTYKKALEIKSEKSFETHLFDNSVSANIDSSFVFASNYELAYLYSMAAERPKTITLATLNKIRTNCVKLWEDKGFDKRFPNAIIEWQKKLISMDYYDCYNYWLLEGGDNAEIEKWADANKEKYDKFVKWFVDNPMNINLNNRFYRTQYNVK
jgi:tetratricopeptide (TPR) repeat protein